MFNLVKCAYCYFHTYSNVIFSGFRTWFLIAGLCTHHLILYRYHFWHFELCFHIWHCFIPHDFFVYSSAPNRNETNFCFHAPVYVWVFKQLILSILASKPHWRWMSFCSSRLSTEISWLWNKGMLVSNCWIIEISRLL